MTEQSNTKQPPKSARRIGKWDDLNYPTSPGLFRVTGLGEDPRTFVASKHMRQVLEGLMNHPIYAASYCRISDQVLPLRRDQGVNIRCDMYSDDKETGRSRYGVYVLESQVERVEESEVAA